MLYVCCFVVSQNLALFCWFYYAYDFTMRDVFSWCDDSVLLFNTCQVDLQNPTKNPQKFSEVILPET